MSRPTLYRLFEPKGGDRAFIAARRLARVADDLRGGDAPSLAALIERWGVADAAQLSRQFRTGHGLLPGDFRAEPAREANRPWRRGAQRL